jgi:mannose-6-phosphate isomerase-like protein (cupin superfamily)
MKTSQATSNARPRILRREESLTSRRYGGVCVRVLYHCDAFEVRHTDMEPGSTLDDAEMAEVNGIHFVISGSPVFRVAGERSDLMPGDSVSVGEGQRCSVSNATAGRSTFLSLVFRGECRPLGAALGGPTADTPRSQKELSR